jgi:hypothetical protein
MISAALKQNFYNKLLSAGCFDANISDNDLRERVRSVYLETDAKLCDLLRAEKSSKKRKPGTFVAQQWRKQI